MCSPVVTNVPLPFGGELFEQVLIAVFYYQVSLTN